LSLDAGLHSAHGAGSCLGARVRAFARTAAAADRLSPRGRARGAGRLAGAGVCTPPSTRRLPRIGSVDAVALEARADSLAKRSIKKEAKLFALELAIRMTDLTTLEGADTPGKVHALATKAVKPDPSDESIPSCAALCVYPNLVPTAVARLRGSGGKVASVATAFPSGQSPLDVKLRETEEVVELGAD